MKLLRAALILAAALLLPGSKAVAQERAISARIVVQPGEITVGDPVLLKLTVTHPPGTIFDFPDAARMAQVPGQEGSPGSPMPAFVVEEVEPMQARPPLPGETSWSIRLRPFAPGDLEVPALPLTYRLAGAGEVQSVTTEPLSIHVKSVLKAPDEAPADIKGPWRIPREWWRVLLYAAAALAMLAVLLIIWLRYRRRRPAPIAPVAPAPHEFESAYERALRELELLLASRLIQEGRIKEFHILLSEIVKRFLGQQHGFDALDRTTEEVLIDLTRARPAADELGRTRAFLQACDLVKFAKHHPAPSEIDETMNAARMLIQTGRPRPEVAAA